jgi:5-methylcytosine-specific restriction protein A
MGLVKYDRADRAIYRDPRWKAVRYLAKKRDGWKCTECGERGRLEVHHIKRVKNHPELAYDLSNLKTLCGKCHARVTRIECGLAVELDPKRVAWRALVRELAQPQTRKEDNATVC